MTQRSRGWILTVNNWTDEQVEKLKGMDTSYIIIGSETAPTTGTRHLQVYLHFENPRSFKSIQKSMPNCWIGKADGSAEKNKLYCSKEEVLYENGNVPKPGKRSDLDKAREIVKSGGGMKQVVEECNSYQSVRMAECWLKYNEPGRDWQPEVLWFWGKSGSGKTKKARELCRDPWISGRNLRWWDGYDAHEDVIVDDFRKDFCTFHELLRILDRYPYRVEVKGGSRQLLAKRIIITAPEKPEDVYDTREDLAQLIRRINSIVHFDTEVMTQRSGVIMGPDLNVTEQILGKIRIEEKGLP